MKTYKWCLLFGSLMLLIFTCQQKKPQVIHEPEKETIEVELPQADWQKTVVITPSDSDAVTRTLTASIARRLRHQGLRILYSEADRSDAEFYVRTSTRQNGNQLEISYVFENIDKDSTSHAMVTYDEESVLQAVEAVTQQVSQNLGDSLVHHGRETSISKSTFQQFLNAESQRSQGTPASLNSAVRIYKEILREDSLFSDAWIGLAESYLFLIEQKWERHHIWLTLAQQAGLKLQDLEQQSGEAECVFGRIALIRGDIQGAEGYFRKAITYNTNLVAAWRGLGQIFGQYGLYDPALEMYNRALDLDPIDLQAGTGKALILGGRGDYGQAIIILKHLISVHPEAVYLNSFLALQYYYQGQYKDAMQYVRTGLNDADYLPLSHAILAMIQAKQGDQDAALGELEMEVKPQAEGNGSLAIAVAAVYTLLERKGEAIQWLEKALMWGYKEYPWLVNDPNFSSLQGDERYQTICDTLKTVYERYQMEYFESRSL